MCAAIFCNLDLGVAEEEDEEFISRSGCDSEDMI
jgi:hypothetical protein